VVTTLHKADVVPLLLDACPGARTAWDEHRADWDDEEPGAFLDMAVFARHVVESAVRGDTDGFHEFFGLVERLLVEGDEEVQGLASVGLIETIQTVSSHYPLPAGFYVPWMGPASQVAWQRIAILWEGEQSLADVIRAERRREL
jgi:hypothetical protein